VKPGGHGPRIFSSKLMPSRYGHRGILSFTRVCIIGMEKGDRHLMGFAKHKPNQARALSLYGRKEACPSRV